MGEFIIPINVREEKELYTEYDPSGLSFSSDFRDYLSDYVEDRKLGEKVCVEIRRNQVNSMRLLVIGIFFIMIGIMSASRSNTVVAAIISTVGSFSVWEASAVWIETLPSLRKRERLLNMFAEAEIRYTGSDTK